MNNQKEKIKKTSSKKTLNKSESNKKRTNKKAAIKKQRILHKEIIGVFLVAISSFLIFAVNQIANLGLFGSLLRNVLYVLFGKGMYILPFVIMFAGIIQLLNVILYSEKKQNIAIVGMFFCLLVLISVGDVVNNSFFAQNSTIKNVLSISLKYNSELVLGGGIFGNIICFILMKLLGIIGIYIFISALMLVFVIVFTNKSMIGFFKDIISFLKKIAKLLYNFIYVEVDNDDNKSIKTNVDKRNTKKGKIQKNIEIIDYSADHDKAKNLQNDITNLKIDDTKDNNQDNINDKEKKKFFFNRDKSVSVDVGPNSVVEVMHIDADEEVNSNVENIEVTKNKTTGSEQIKIDDVIKVDENDNDSVVQEYILPDSELLNNPKRRSVSVKDDLRREAEKLVKTLESFNIQCTITQISRGPTITRYELQPAPGIKVSRITSLANDIALSLATSDIRIEAPIPGKSAVGIEVPNKEKTDVIFKSLVESKEFKNINTKVPFALGKDIAGKNIIGNIEKMPHLLVAGATGSGKSVCINTLIMSILYKSKPDEVKLILVDPKVVELSVYNGIPHLLIPVVTDPRKASNALNWAVSEMTNRYKIFASNSVRDIFSYNAKMLKENNESEKMPQIVIIIDELADLMQVAPGEVEESITRIAQLARACGIHLVIATQRPSVDVITGTIKANIPSRIAFAVSSYIDSRTILDTGGAEKLLGKGDMLYHPIGLSKPIRIQGTFISDDEIKRAVDFITDQKIKQKTDDLNKEIEKAPIHQEKADELLEQAIELVVNEGQASASYLQRRFSIGYNRAARLIDSMEERGIIGGREGSKPRKVLMTKEELEEMKE